MAFAEIFIHVLPALDNPFVACVQQLEGVDLYDCVEFRHLIDVESLPDHIVDKEDLGA